jgi:hypothetical protein
MNAKAISAFLVDCKPGELINYRMEGSMAVFVGPDGKKYRLTAEQLGKGEIAMQQKQTLAEAAAQPAPKPKPKRKPKRKPTTKRKIPPKE